MFKAVCFDFDYTLGDGTDSIVAGFQYGLTQLGWPAPDREAIRATIGYLLEDSYAMLTGDSDPARQAQFRTLFTQAALERQRRETILFPGAAELLRALKAQGIKTAIVSTKRGDTIEVILERLGVADTIALVIGSADVKRTGWGSRRRKLSFAETRFWMPEPPRTPEPISRRSSMASRRRSILPLTTPTTSLPICGTWPSGWQYKNWDTGFQSARSFSSM